MAKYKKVCPRCGTLFETDSARRKYCFGSCSYDAMMEQRPVNNKRRRDKEKYQKRLAKLLCKTPLAEINERARDAGMTYGQFESWQRCQEEIALRQEERNRGIRFFDKYINILGGCSNGEFQQGAQGI